MQIIHRYIVENLVDSAYVFPLILKLSLQMLRAGFHSTSLDLVACTNKEPSLLHDGDKICMKFA